MHKIKKIPAIHKHSQLPTPYGPFLPEIWSLPIKKECIFFGLRSGVWNSMLQVKCLDHIISEEERTPVANEKQMRKDKLCSLGGRWALFVPVAYCGMMFWWPLVIRWCFVFYKQNKVLKIVWFLVKVSRNTIPPTCIASVLNLSNQDDKVTSSQENLAVSV